MFMKQQIDPILQLAQKKTGLLRETLLFHALNEIFDLQVTTESDWQTASSEDLQKWKRQIEMLLGNVEYSISSADSYSGEESGLLNQVQRIQRENENHQNRIEQLRQEKLKLKALLNDSETSYSLMTQEVNTLQGTTDALKKDEHECKKLVSKIEKENKDLQNTTNQLKAKFEHLLSDKESLENEQTSLSSELLKLKDGLEDLKGQNATLRNDLDVLNSDCQAIENEVNLLQALKELIPFRKAIREAFNENLIHSLANSDIVQNLNTNKQQLTALGSQVKNALEEQDRLLKDDISLVEKQWEILRKNVQQ